MKIKLGMISNVYKTTVEKGTDRNTGKEFQYGKVIIEQDGSLSEMTCSSVLVPEIEVMKENKFVCEYDTYSKKLKIVGLAK